MPNSSTFEFEAEQVESLPEQLRGVLEERDGKFVLEVPDVGGLKSALQKERESRASAEKKLKEFKKVDVDALTKELDDLRQKASSVDQSAESGDQVKELVSQQVSRAREEWGKRENELRSQLEQANSALESQAIQSAILRVMEDPDTKLRVRKGAVEDVLEHARRTFRRVEGQVIPMEGETPVYSSKDPTRAMSIEEWLSDLATKKEFFFEPSRGAGTSNSGGAKGAAPQNISRSKMTYQQKSQFIREHGQEAYLKLPK